MTTAKQRVKKYAFGGDPVTPKPKPKGRLVSAIPQGYIPLEGVEGYYHNPKQSKANGSNKKMSDVEWTQFMAKNPNWKSSSQSDDIVYMQPTKTQPALPAYMTKNMDGRVYHANKVAAGDYDFNVLNGDITNPQNNTKTVNYRPIDNLGKPTGEYYENIPLNEWNSVSGDQSIDTRISQFDKYRTQKGTAKMAMGGDTIAGIGKEVPGLIDSIMQLIDGDSSAYSRQPIVNASAIRNMATPYSKMAMGGSIEDLDEEELASLQQMAEEQGISLEEAFAQSQQDDTGEEDYDPNEDQYDDEDVEDHDTGMLSGIFANSDEGYAYGGIHIKKKNKGKFNALKKRTGKTTAQLKNSPNLLTRKRAAFAANAAKWKHAYGGTPIEVEGGEVMQTPNGDMHHIQGPKHEQGGVDIKVPSGTEIFSNRLKIEGKSMKARKLAREDRMAKMEKLMSGNPHNQLIKNTVSRTMEHLDREDKQDMALQKVASRIYAPPQLQSTKENNKVRDTDGKSYAFGGDLEDGDPFLEYMNTLNGTDSPWNVKAPYAPPSYSRNPIPLMEKPNPVVTGISNNPSSSMVYNGSRGYAGDSSNDKPNLMGSMTTGDYVGLAGTAFGAIAPIINTRNARNATKPNVNRFLNFGKDAIDANDTAQGYIAGLQSSELADIDTASNTSYVRNNNSASSINTVRALDAVTDLQSNKARNGARNNAARNMMALLNTRGQLTNVRDFQKATAQTRVDSENKSDTDNYYTNMGANLSNLATGVETIGKNLNISHGNKVDANLISQLSRYGLEFDEAGNLITKK